jgi:ATP:corrinoid adenosyltransferase
MSLARYLVEAEEVALEIDSRPSEYESITAGRVSARTAQEIRAAVAEIRKIEQSAAPDPRRR